MPFKKYKSIRLKEYDYSLPGAYFVTICAQQRKRIFGKIENETMILNEAGTIASKDIADIAAHYENVGVGEFVVMPNHVHMVIYNYDSSGGGQVTPPTDSDYAELKSIRLQDIVGSYKSGVTRKARKVNGFEKFGWQRYYFDHIVRNEIGLENISGYIRINPARWNEDIENESYFTELSESERIKKAEEFYKTLIK